ncbi:MAG: hypothetical protein HZA31_03450 [Opitutae bacterium]|nr:hypothetical protein [Opitutae bacterium]
MADPKTTSKQWDEVRVAFASSIMVDTALGSLAQNLDGPDWPIKGKEETPATYIDLTFTEAQELLALKGQPPERIDQLVAILRDTLAFDNPFGEMVEQVEVAAQKDNQLLKNLARLEIPENFPIEFTALAAGTREFCQLERIVTIGEFAVFAQNMSQNVIVGGDFRTLLNALAQVDEAGLAQFLPVRPGSKGLHLPEAVALGVRALTPAVRAALAKKAGAKLSATEAATAATADKTAVQAADADLRDRAARLATEWCRADRAHLQQQLAAGTTLARLLVVLGDPAIEACVAEYLHPHLKTEQSPTAGSASATAPAAPKRGFFARLFGRK